MTRIEVDHLNVRDAFNALGVPGASTGLGYNAAGVSYHWEMTKNRDGSVVVEIAGRFFVGASLTEVARRADLPVCGFVSRLVQAETGNDALELIARVGE